MKVWWWFFRRRPQVHEPACGYCGTPLAVCSRCRGDWGAAGGCECGVGLLCPSGCGRFWR